MARVTIDLPNINNRAGELDQKCNEPAGVSQRARLTLQLYNNVCVLSDDAHPRH